MEVKFQFDLSSLKSLQKSHSIRISFECLKGLATLITSSSARTGAKCLQNCVQNEKSTEVGEYQCSVISGLSFMSLTLIYYIWLLKKLHSAIHSGLWHRHATSTVVTSYGTTGTELVIFYLCQFSHIIDTEDLRVLNHVFYTCLAFGKRIPSANTDL